MIRTRKMFLTAVAATLAAALGLGACNRPGEARASTGAAGPACASSGSLPQSKPLILAESRGGPIALSGPAVVRLWPVCSAVAVTDRIRSAGPKTRYLLVADDLRVGAQPGVLFRLSLGGPGPAEPAVLGTLNFFAARRPGAAGPPRRVSYDVTRPVRALATSGWPAGGLGVAIVPQGRLEHGSTPVIGALRLVAEPR